MTSGNPLADEGFFVVERALDQDDCSALLREVIATFATASRTPIRKRHFRVHAPLRMTPRVLRSVQAVLGCGYAAVRSFLERETFLVELSSITAFPGAAAQPFHRDEYEHGKFIVSAFVNLAPTAAGVGALAVRPGTHKTADRLAGEVRTLELPTGSVVFMNGKLCHAGTANTSADRFRPVFYFSFGDSDMRGPVYSLRPELQKKYRLSDFERGRPPGDAPLRILEDLALAESADGGLRLTMNGDDLGTIRFSGDAPWQGRALLALREEPMPVGRLAARVGVDPKQIGELVEQASQRGVLVY